MWGHEQALEQEAVIAEAGTALPADAGGGQTHGGPLHKLRRTRDISPRRRDAAAGIFDKGADYKVSACIAGLEGIGKFPVAVVHHDANGGVNGFHGLDDSADLRHGQGSTVLIAARALDHHARHILIPDGFGDGGIVGAAVRGEVDLAVVDTVKFERAKAVAGNADGGAQGIIRRTGDREDLLARLCKREHGSCQGMGAVDKLDAHKGGFRTENVGVDFIQGLTAQIVVAVAGGAGKAGVGDAVVLESLHNLSGILPRDRVDLPKARGKLCLSARRHVVYLGFNI